MNKKLSLLFVLPLLSLASCTPEPSQIKVTFQDDLGNEIYSVDVYEDADVYYRGELPSKESDETYFYTFSHWDKNLNHVRDSIVTKPVFTKTKRVDNTSFEYTDSVLYIRDISSLSDVIIPTHANGEMISSVYVGISKMSKTQQYDFYIPSHIEEFTFGTTYEYTDYSNINLYFEGNMDDWAGVYKSMYSFFVNKGNLYVDGKIVDEIVISEGVDTLRSGTLSNPNITKISIPNSLKTIEGDPYLFYGIDSSLYLHEDNNYYLGNETNPYLYSVYADDIDYSNQDLRINGKCEFVEMLYHNNAKNIYIHEKVRKIGINFATSDVQPNVYFECTYEDYFRIGFDGCIFKTNNIYINGENVTSKESISIPNTIETLKSLSLSSFKSLKEITIPDNIKLVEKRAFSGCENLEYVHLGNGVNKLQYSAFNGYKGAVVVPKNVVTVEREAFSIHDFTSIYIEHDSKPDGWDDNWIYLMNQNPTTEIAKSKIHWNGEWEMENGRPISKK